MTTLQESLFISSKSNSKTKDKKTRQNQSKNNKLLQENNISSESLLSSSENDNDNIELGSIDSDDDDEKTKLNARHILRSRHIKQESAPAAYGGGSIVIVEKPIQPQETIQAFAIRYRVPVSQLKRLNNLQNDQDFYALTYCRVPVRRFGLLHEPSLSSTILNLNEQTTANTSLPVTHLSQQNHHAFLNAMDNDLASMRVKVEQLIETPTKTLILDQPTTNMMVRLTKKPISELNCDGADCGCKFWHIVLIIVLIALLIPFIYLYLYIISPRQITEHFSF